MNPTKLANPPNSADATAALVHKLDKELSSKRALLVDRHAYARTSLRIMLSMKDWGQV